MCCMMAVKSELPSKDKNIWRTAMGMLLISQLDKSYKNKIFWHQTMLSKIGYCSLLRNRKMMNILAKVFLSGCLSIC